MAKATEWISVPKAAEMMGCTDVWVLRLIKRGHLEGFQLNGRAWAVSRAAVAKNIEEHAQRDPTQAGRPRSRLA